MFQQLKNIDSAFRHLRWFCIALVAACATICCFVVYQSLRVAERASQRIFVLSNGKALEAIASDRKDNIPVEARDHISTFHQLFFRLDPDEKVIEANIKKSLYLADASAKKQYDDLKENNYYASIVSGNVSQEIATDSIRLDLEQYPYSFRYYGRQCIIRPSSIVVRNLITEGYLRSVARSDNNSHGFLIERWKTIENRDLSVEKR